MMCELKDRCVKLCDGMVVIIVLLY